MYSLRIRYHVFSRRYRINRSIPIEGEPLDSLKLARRISLDIRGKYLSSAEVQEVQTNPEALDASLTNGSKNLNIKINWLPYFLR